MCEIAIAELADHTANRAECVWYEIGIACWQITVPNKPSVEFLTGGLPATTPDMRLAWLSLQMKPSTRRIVRDFRRTCFANGAYVEYRVLCLVVCLVGEILQSNLSLLLGLA